MTRGPRPARDRVALTLEEFGYVDTPIWAVDEALEMSKPELCREMAAACAPAGRMKRETCALVSWWDQFPKWVVAVCWAGTGIAPDSFA